MSLADDVQRWMAGETVTAYREHISQRIGRWIRNNRLLSQFIAVAVVIALVAGTSLSIVARLNRLAAESCAI